MKKTLLSFAIIAAFAGNAFALADTATSSSATGGGGGAGGQASGGIATGGSGGAASVTGTGTSSASGGASAASVGNTNVSVGGTTTGGTTINYNSPERSVSESYSSGDYNSTISGKQTLEIDQKSSGTVTNRTEVSGTTTLKNVPDVALGGYASGPCTGVSANFGISVPGLGLGGGGASIDEGCTLREFIRISAMIGRMDIANLLLESSPLVAKAMSARTEAVDKEKQSKLLKEQQLAAVKVIENKKAMSAVADTVIFTSEVAPVAAQEVYVPTDPFVRARMGLAPL